MKTGVLLVNLGTPNSPEPKDVYRYLTEFLTDKRVIDGSWLFRQLLVRGIIVPSRYHQSALSYKAIWTPSGSPLLVHGKNLKKILQDLLGDSFCVELGMRYQSPSLASAIAALFEKEIHHLIVVPLFPQYASATTGSVFEKVMELLQHQARFPRLTFIDQFATHPAFINAVATLGATYRWEEYDQVLFSFHGLPQRYLKQEDRHEKCLQKTDCCKTLCTLNRFCYSAQCYATAQSIAQSLNIPQNRYRVCFQSRLGKEPWLQPYATDTIHSLGKEGKKHLLVFSPSFVCDCLETTFEIGVEYAKEFQMAGGERLDLVPGLNAEPIWGEALKTIILDQI